VASRVSSAITPAGRTDFAASRADPVKDSASIRPTSSSATGSPVCANLVPKSVTKIRKQFLKIKVVSQTLFKIIIRKGTKCSDAVEAT
jgi:hypothetical protein